MRDPQKTMPRAILGALAIVTTIYVLVAVSALGTQPWEEFGDAEQGEAGLAKILQDVVGASWPGTILSAGAVISIFSVTLVTMYGQTRILFAIGRDGLLPRAFARVNPRTHTPVNNTVIVAIVVGLLAAFIPLDYLWDLVSIGTLIAFIVVSVGVVILRRTRPDLPRGFKVPGYPVTPVLAVLACLYILSGLHWYTYAWFLLWLAVVLAFYFLWGRKHSLLQRAVEAGPGPRRGPAMTIVVGANPFGDLHGAHRPGRHPRPHAARGHRRVRAGRRDGHPAGLDGAVDGPGRRRDAGVDPGARRRGGGRRARAPRGPRRRPDRRVRPADGPVDAPRAGRPRGAAGRHRAGARLVAATDPRAASSSARPPTTCCTPPRSRWPSPRARTGARRAPTDVAAHRLTCSFSGSGVAASAVRWAARLTREIDVQLRVASFGVRSATMYPPEIGTDIESEVTEQWREQMAEAQAALRRPELDDGHRVRRRVRDQLDARR